MFVINFILLAVMKIGSDFSLFGDINSFELLRTKNVEKDKKGPI